MAPALQMKMAPPLTEAAVAMVMCTLKDGHMARACNESDQKLPAQQEPQGLLPTKTLETSVARERNLAENNEGRGIVLLEKQDFKNALSAYQSCLSHWNTVVTLYAKLQPAYLHNVLFYKKAQAQETKQREIHQAAHHEWHKALVQVSCLHSKIASIQTKLGDSSGALRNNQVAAAIAQEVQHETTLQRLLHHMKELYTQLITEKEVGFVDASINAATFFIKTGFKLYQERRFVSSLEEFQLAAEICRHRLEKENKAVQVIAMIQDILVHEKEELRQECQEQAAQEQRHKVQQARQGQERLAAQGRKQQQEALFRQLSQQAKERRRQAEERQKEEKEKKHHPLQRPCSPPSHGETVEQDQLLAKYSAALRVPDWSDNPPPGVPTLNPPRQECIVIDGPAPPTDDKLASVSARLAEAAASMKASTTELAAEQTARRPLKKRRVTFLADELKCSPCSLEMCQACQTLTKLFPQESIQEVVSNE